MQGDQVLVEVEPPKADGRQQGRIVRILERRNPTVVGTFRVRASGSRPGNNVVIPFDDRMTQPIVIPPGAEIPDTPPNPPRRIACWALELLPVQNLRARRAWRASSSMSRSPVGPRPPVRPLAE